MGPNFLWVNIELDWLSIIRCKYLIQESRKKCLKINLWPRILIMFKFYSLFDEYVIERALRKEISRLEYNFIRSIGKYFCFITESYQYQILS